MLMAVAEELGLTDLSKLIKKMTPSDDDCRGCREFRKDIDYMKDLAMKIAMGRPNDE